MSHRVGRGARPVLGAAVAVLLLAGCGAGGTAEYADGDYGYCLEQAGLPVEEAEEWSEEYERHALSQAETMACVLEELPAEERRDALGKAFPEVDGDDDPSYDQEAAAAAVAAYVEERGVEMPDDELVATAAELLAAVGVTERYPAAPWMAVSLAILETRGVTAYDAWLERTGRGDNYDGVVDFVSEQERAGTDLGHRLNELRHAMLDAPHEPAPDPEAALTGDTCVQVGEDAPLGHVTVPAGFGREDDESLDVEYVDAGYADEHPDALARPTVGLVDAANVGMDDQGLLLFSLVATAPGGGATGEPEWPRLQRQVRKRDLTAATWTTQRRPDEAPYSVYAEVHDGPAGRFAVTVLAPAGAEYDALTAEVLPTVGSGGCGI